MNDDRCIHEGVKIRRWNTPIDLTETEFSDDRYLVSMDVDVYPTENYGDWRRSNAQFRIFVDRLNIDIAVESHLLWYYMSKLTDHPLTGKKTQFLRVWAAYQKPQTDQELDK
ncbi:hypothetical protein H0A71_22980 [Alcaligenaceae bacterium]|nr:hypothetical protein [Alcaligenaceae bacterium]